MDLRTSKLALARKKLKDHQIKKVFKCDVPELNIQDDSGLEPRVELATDINVNTENTDNDKDIKIEDSAEGSDVYSKVSSVEIETKTADVLISNKRNLESQIQELHAKILQLENSYDTATSYNNIAKQQITNLETELSTIKERYVVVSDQLALRENVIEEYKAITSSLTQEKNNLYEQLEFTKTVLTAKETENVSLHGQLTNMQNLLEANQLRLQQLTNGSVSGNGDNLKIVDSDEKESLMQKISCLEQQLKSVQKERDQINSHYEHYVSQLNEELKLAIRKNEELTKETDVLTTRENGLIEQISNMEIQIQNLRCSREIFKDDNVNDPSTNELQKKYDELQEQLRYLQLQNKEINKKLKESEHVISDNEEKNDFKQDNYDMNNICISKLNADIENDKIAAQRATEQNKKLKTDLQELEEAFVKMSNDKLELTEKLDAEKFLNRELTIKLAENVEKAKDMQTKLKAKDEEMIRLVTNYQDIEKKLDRLTENHTNYIKENNSNEVTNTVITGIDSEMENHQLNTEVTSLNEYHNCTTEKSECNAHPTERMNDLIPKEDAMVKLQERFFKIMGEVADLSDEKHRLEHIIMQLQNETDTICEYVALYQQQRSLLKLRDEERNAQIKIFKSECDRMRSQLNEVSEIIVKIIQDKELSAYFETESRQEDVTKMLNILRNMKNNVLVNSHNQFADMKNFYPCACCSGNIIDL